MHRPLARVAILAFAVTFGLQALAAWTAFANSQRLLDIANLLAAGLGLAVSFLAYFLARREEQQLRERQYAEAMRDRLAAIVESSGDAIYSQTLDGVITSWNAGAERMFGYASQEIVGLPAAILLPGAEADEGQAILERIHRGGQGEGYEAVRRKKNGERIVVSFTLAPIRDASGAIVGVSKIARDVTTQKQAEAAIRESEARFRQLADAMPQIVWAARPDGYVDYFNRRWYEFTGFPEGQSGDESWMPILHADDLQRCLDQWYTAVRSGTGYEIEYRFKDRRSGGYRWQLGRALPVRDAAGQIVRWFGTCTDIDDQKRIAEALRAADRRKDEFLAMLAHELRNPLAPMRNAVALLQRRPAVDDEQVWAQSVIERQLGHLTHLVDDLLDVSRITRGKIQLQRQPLTLATLVDAAVETVQSLIDAQHQKLMVTPPPPNLWIDGDLTRLAQVASNLLNNASKYTPEGGCIWFTATQEGSEAVLRIRDNGMGIPAEMVPHVFDLFTQGGRNLDRSQGGLGIGLTIVRRLVEMHGGQVTAASEGPDRGTEFTVRLPLVEAPRLAAPPAVRPAAPAAGGRRVLVVDDNRDALQSLAMLLEVNGYEVDTAPDGPTALRLARSFTPEIILLDIGLPGMNGYEVAEKLRADPNGSEVILIALTGYGQAEDRQRSKEAGFDRHLVKPVDPETLEAVFAEMLEGSVG